MDKKIKGFHFVYPLRCPVCRGFLKEKEELICKKCEKMELPSFSYAKEQPGFVKGITGLFPYEKKYRKALQRWKYKGVRKYGKTFATLLAKQLLKQESLQEIECIVPVPLAKRRYRKRGFNQAYDLAKELSVLLEIPLEEALIRKRMTKPQSGLKKTQRMGNVFKSMELSSKKSLKGVTKIALVDDIYTTGSTMRECIRAITDRNKENQVTEIEIHIWVVCKPIK